MFQKQRSYFNIQMESFFHDSGKLFDLTFRITNRKVNFIEVNYKKKANNTRVVLDFDAVK